MHASAIPGETAIRCPSLFVNRLVRHTPGSSAVIRFANGERIAITIAPTGIVIAKLAFSSRPQSSRPGAGLLLAGPSF
jgi:hypothetical protein